MRATWKCHKIQTRLWERIEGKLDADEAQRVQAHLDRCDVCRAEWDRVRATVPLIVLLRNRPTPGSTTDFADVVRRIAARHRQHSRPEARWRIVPAALAVAAAVVLYAITTRQVRPYAAHIVSAGHPATENRTAIWIRPKEFNPSRAPSHLIEPTSPLTGGKPTQVAAMPRRALMKPERLALAATSAHPDKATPERFGNRRRRHLTSGMPDRHERAIVAPEQSDSLVLAADDDRSLEMDGVSARMRAPARAFVMPPMQTQQLDEAPRRSFVIDNIPNTTSAGQVGTAAAIQNSETGRAL